MVKRCNTHNTILPVIVKTGESRVLVLEPEFTSPQDGHEKQDCERAAIKRWVKRNGARFADHEYTLLGDDLYACQPICDLFLEKNSSHLTLQQKNS